MTVVRDQLFPQKPPGSRFRFSRTGVQPSPGSSTIELPSAFAESGGMEREACVCDHGYERSDLCAEIIIIIATDHKRTNDMIRA